MSKEAISEEVCRFMGHILDEVEDRAAASDEDLGLVIDEEDSVSTLTSLSVITSGSRN